MHIPQQPKYVHAPECTCTYSVIYTLPPKTVLNIVHSGTFVIQNSNLYAAVKNLSETGLVFVARYCTPIQKCIAVMSKFEMSWSLKKWKCLEGEVTNKLSFRRGTCIYLLMFQSICILSVKRPTSRRSTSRGECILKANVFIYRQCLNCPQLHSYLIKYFAFEDHLWHFQGKHVEMAQNTCLETAFSWKPRKERQH